MPVGNTTQHDVWASGNAYEPFVGRWSRWVAREFIEWLSLRLVGEVGSTSVPSRRKSTMAQTGRIHEVATNKIPKGASGTPGTLNQPINQLIGRSCENVD